MDLYVLSILVFMVFFALVLYRDRKNIEIKGILIMRKTKKGRKFIDNIAKASPKFWKIFGSIGVVVCFFAMVFGLHFLVSSIRAPTGGPGISLVIPFPTQDTTIGYGYVGVPFWFFIIGVFSLVLPHEGMHGILSRAENIRIKNLGLMLLAIIPGAFVEPDEKQLKKANWKTKLRIYAGGSFSNFIVAGLVSLFMFFVLSPAFLTESVGYVGYTNSTYFGEEPYPAQESNMTGVIVSIDGQRIRNAAELNEFMENRKPGDNVLIETISDSYNITLAENPTDSEKGFIGISGVGDRRVISKRYKNTSFEGVLQFIIEMFEWIFIINLGVGLVNIFPIKPLDGGLMVDSLFERFAPKKRRFAVRALAAIFLSLIITNFLVGFI